jgi:hypothetical protein
LHPPADLEPNDARLAAETMQEQVTALPDLSLTLEHDREMEQLQWFVMAHLENTSGQVPSSEESDQLEAAAVAAASDPRACPKFGVLSFGEKNPKRCLGGHDDQRTTAGHPPTGRWCRA